MFEADNRPGGHANTVPFSRSHNHKKLVDVDTYASFHSGGGVLSFLLTDMVFQRICEQISWYRITCPDLPSRLSLMQDRSKPIYLPKLLEVS